jgi:hypothetical protein
MKAEDIAVYSILLLLCCLLELYIFHIIFDVLLRGII